ncbi:MAG: sce7726 family protein [Bacteroidota bacterium]
MAVNSTYSTLLKSISPVLSNTTFSQIAHNQGISTVVKKAKKYSQYNSDATLATYNDFFEHLYHSMLKNYRNEYVYKNLIVNKILLGRHSLNTATCFNEFRIGKSVADLVLLNGTSVVYEIKTEYDSPERLLSQVNEYRKTFLNVVIVTHHSVVRKYESFLRENNLDKVGLIYLTSKRTLAEAIGPVEDISALDISYMFKCLRKKEYTKIIKEYFGFLPDVPNTRIFRECLALAKKIDPVDFHLMMFEKLKKRTIREKDQISSPLFPHYLKHIGVCSDFKKEEIERISSFINRKI